MFRANLGLILWSGLGLWAAAACAADPWQNCQIMPKSDQLLLKVGQGISGDVFQVAWPATVERIEGQWLFVVDKGPNSVPAISGWVNKDEVLKVGEAQAYYMESLQTADAPSTHWLLGICLEAGNESETAQQEYLRALSLDAVRGADPNAARMAVQMNPSMLDAAIGLQRLRAAAAKSAEEAVAAADQLKNLADDAKSRGVRRPHAFFQQVEALNKAYRLKLDEERQQLHGIDAQIARAISEKDGGTAEDQALFKKANDLYQITASLDPSYAQAGPHIWKGCMGRAELYLSRVAFLNDEAWALIGAAGAPKAFAAAATGSANHPGTATVPVDLKSLEAFAKSCQDSKQGPAAAHAVCFCLAAEIQSLDEAVKCFDQAVAQRSDLVEAYRDRGLTYLALARCEATLAAILTALEKVDPDFQKQLLALQPDGALLPQKLDRALVVGRRQFDDALELLRTAKAQEALVATQKQELARAAGDLANNYFMATVKHGSLDAKAQKAVEVTTATQSTLATIREQLELIRSAALEAEKPLDLDEAKAKQDLSRANAAIEESCAMLNKSGYLRSAEQSARSACGKENFASGGSLQILAEIYASQCNFDRASFYQKLAVIFASDDERPQLLRTLHDYEKIDQLATETARPKTLLLQAGPGKGAKPSGGDSSAGDSTD